MEGIDKLTIVVDGRTLLARAYDAAAGARRLVVVGPPAGDLLPPGAIRVQEEPPFSGPAAAMGAGLAGLGDDVAEHVLVIAADVPRVAEVAQTLIAALAAHPDRDGVVALSARGRRQPLLALHRTRPLSDALREHEPLAGLSAMRVTGGLDLAEVSIADEVLADIDTPYDLQRLTEETDHG